MKKYILIGRTYVEIPQGLKVVSLRPRAIVDTISLVERGLDKDLNIVAIIDALRLRDGNEVRIMTKLSGGVVYWLIQDWFGRANWAAGVFSCGDKHHTEEVAVALPAMRGRGLYTSVLRHIRKTYKKSLLSDRRLSMANILAWMRAGAVVGSERFKINPNKPWIKDFVALETIII
jgi:hypothetical protein